jgi:hypothetical protein
MDHGCRAAGGMAEGFAGARLLMLIGIGFVFMEAGHGGAAGVIGSGTLNRKPTGSA